MDRALHPALAKHALGQDPGRTAVLDLTTRDEMVEATARGAGRQRDVPDRRDPRSTSPRCRATSRASSSVRPSTSSTSSSPASRAVADHRSAVALGGWPWSARLTPRGGPTTRHRPNRRESRRAPATRKRPGSSSATASASSTRSTATGEPTILLMPTWSIVHSRLWKTQIPYLARHCRVVDVRRTRQRPLGPAVEPEAYREEEFAADALAVLDATATDGRSSCRCRGAPSERCCSRPTTRSGSRGWSFIAPALSARDRQRLG